MRKLMTAAAVIALGFVAGCKMESGNDAQKPATQEEIVQPQAGEQQPGQGGSGTGDDMGNWASPDQQYPNQEQINTSEDEVQQGQGNEAEGFQGGEYEAQPESER